MAGFSRLLVPTDLEAGSNPGLSFAREVASEYGWSLHLFHVTSAQELPINVDMRHDTPVGEVLAEERAAFDALLASMPAGTTGEIVYGDPVLEILEAIPREGCDGVLITVKNRSRVGKLLMGSKAQEILLRSPVPVIAVPRGDT